MRTPTSTKVNIAADGLAMQFARQQRMCVASTHSGAFKLGFIRTTQKNFLVNCKSHTSMKACIRCTICYTRPTLSKAAL
jgi:hypothetical protein